MYPSDDKYPSVLWHSGPAPPYSENSLETGRGFLPCHIPGTKLRALSRMSVRVFHQLLPHQDEYCRLRDDQVLCPFEFQFDTL